MLNGVYLDLAPELIENGELKVESGNHFLMVNW